MDSGHLSAPFLPPRPGDTTRKNPPGLVLPLPIDTPAPSEGVVVGRYRLERVLGRGGMGVVYQAEATALRRKVALKVLAAPDDPELVERFQIEARAAARIDHPNVVRVHDVGRDGDRWFLAMDLVEGESLRARIARDGPLDPDAAAHTVEAVARALHHAHGLGVLHRDVKPHNVLVAADGTPRLADFGLAKLQGDAASDGLTATGAVIGTPAYMAPEQALGDLARVDRRTDVYALGATLYEALTGRPPFEGPTAVNILHQVLERAPAPPSSVRPGLDRDLETICLHALEKEPGARYDTAAGFADDLARWSRGEPIVARRAGAGERLVKWARRRPLATAAVVALAMGAAAAATGLVATRVARQRLVEQARREAHTALDAIGAADSSAPAVVRAERLARTTRALDAARAWRHAAPGPEAEAHLARAALEAGDQARLLEQYSIARAAYETAAEAAPGDAELQRSARAASALERGFLLRRASAREARGHLDVARELRPRWPQVWLELAEASHGVGDFEEAEQYLSQAMSLIGPEPMLLLKRASLRTTLARYEEALRDLEAVEELLPDEHLVWLQTTTARLAVGDADGALVAADRALALAGGALDQAKALVERAFVRSRRRELDDAIADLARATTLAPDWSFGWAQLGRVLRRAQRLPEAEAALARAKDLGMVRDDALHEAALLSVELGRPSAAADIEEALRRRPDDGALLLRRAWLRAQREPLAAERDLARALQVLQREEVAKALFVRAVAARAQEQFERAEADASAAIALAPEFPLPWLARGVLRGNRGDRASAIADLQRYLQLAPQAPDAAEVRRMIDLLRRP